MHLLRSIAPRFRNRARADLERFQRRESRVVARSLKKKRRTNSKAGRGGAGGTTGGGRGGSPCPVRFGSSATGRPDGRRRTSMHPVSRAFYEGKSHVPRDKYLAAPATGRFTSTDPRLRVFPFSDFFSFVSCRAECERRDSQSRRRCIDVAINWQITKSFQREPDRKI